MLKGETMVAYMQLSKWLSTAKYIELFCKINYNFGTLNVMKSSGLTRSATSIDKQTKPDTRRLIDTFVTRIHARTPHYLTLINRFQFHFWSFTISGGHRSQKIKKRSPVGFPENTNFINISSAVTIKVVLSFSIFVKYQSVLFGLLLGKKKLK